MENTSRPEFSQSPETINQQDIFKSFETICTQLQRPNLKEHLLKAYAHGETSIAEKKPASNIILIINNPETNEPEFTAKIYTHQGRESECVREFSALRHFSENDTNGIKYPKIIYVHPTPNELPILITSYEPGREPNLEDPNQRPKDLSNLLSYYIITEKPQPKTSDYPLLSQNYSDTYSGFIDIFSRKFLDKFDANSSPSQAIDFYHEISNRLSHLKEKYGKELISQGQTVISRQDEHPFQFLIQSDGTIVPLDWGDGGVQARFLGFADFILHQQTHIPSQERYDLIQQFIKEQDLNQTEISDLKRCLEVTNLKWASILLRNSQPGYISKHPLARISIGINHEEIRKEILSEIDTRLKLDFSFLTSQ